jgi:nucleotide-binding universal stress UspA family protein
MSVDIQTILVATDFSTAAEAATTYAFQLARSLGAHVTLLHVVPESDVEVVVVALRGHLQSHISHEALIQTFYTNAEKQLAALVDHANAQDLVQECRIVTGQPAREIVRWATAKQAQLILVGKHAGTYGRSGLDHVLLGSVAERVLRLASCAVLVVPMPQKDPTRQT